MQWRIASLIAIGDLERRAGSSWRRCSTWPVRMRQPFAMHVGRAVRGGDRALRRAPARGGGGGRAVAGVEPAARRPRSVERLRHPDVRHPARAGAARRAGAGRARRSPPRTASAAWRPGLAALHGRAGDARRRRAPSSSGSAQTASTRCARRSGWRRSRTWPTSARSSAMPSTARLVYAELLPHSGSSVMIGHARRVLRRRRPLPGDARRDARRPGRGGRATSRPRWRSTARRARTRGSPTPRTSTRGCSGPAASRGRRGPGGRAPGRGGRAREADRHAGAARADAAVGRPGSSRPAGRLSPREVEILRLVARGISNRDVGRALSISEHTAANHIRSILRKTGAANRTEAAAYAHANGLDRGVTSSNAALHRRTQLRRPARSDGRRRPPDRRGQRRGGHDVALLVPERRSQAVVLPLRGAVARRDPGRGEAEQTSRPTRSSRSTGSRRASCPDDPEGSDPG